MNDPIIDKLLALMDKSVADFLKAVGGIENDVFNNVVKLTREFDIAGGRLVNNVKNMRLIGKLKGQLQQIVLNDNYIGNVTKFVNAYYEVADLQHDYFKSTVDDFTLPAVVDEIKKQAIESTVESLTEAGISSNVIEPILQILRQNISQGGTMDDYISQMKNFITENSERDGALLRYASQITSDAIHQYSAQYMHAIGDDLGFEWYAVTVSLIKTSREFCINLKEKGYFHKSEIPDIIDHDWKGKIEETTASNFVINRGGWNCRHQYIPVLKPPSTWAS